MSEIINNEEDNFNIEDEESLDTFASESLGQELVNSSLLANVTVSQDTDNFQQEVESWKFRSKMARFESEKEFSMFSVFCNSGSGRSTKYISFTYNIPQSRIDKIAEKNSWLKRAADFDRYQLQLMLQQEKTARAEEHKRKLEEYRLQQEFIGRSLSADAAKLAAIVSGTLDKFIANDREVDMRDLPALLNAAAKAADMGRNLQSSSLGVDQLLVALEEYDE
jgi:hypothetical protein